ncbi:MAG: thiamine-phosphate kinase [bacterium]|nr:thiamine-phosphate kinase [bacterium]
MKADRVSPRGEYCDVRLLSGGAAAYDAGMTRRDRTLSDLGEGALIERITRRAGREIGRDWALGIGDDAAILSTRRGEELVFSTDAQVEGVHFRFGRETPRTIGRRALAVNLSDLAAMGARPVGALMSLSAPSDASVSVFDGVIAGFVDEARRFDCPLVGGNLSSAGEWSLDVTVIGRCRKGGALRRRGLGPGDGLYVTGMLGAAALARLRADRAGTRLTRVPTPRLEAGQALVGLPGTRGCIDLSDGLATDLDHLLAADGWGADIDPASLPRARGFDRGCRDLGLDPLGVIAGGGEDYELLFAFRSDRNRETAATLSARLGVPVRQIGRITVEKGVRGLPATDPGHHFAPQA